MIEIMIINNNQNNFENHYNYHCNDYNVNNTTTIILTIIIIINYNDKYINILLL